MLAFHRRIAVLSVFVAMLAGSLDAMLWREAQRDAERLQMEAQIAAQRAENEAFEAGAEVRPGDLDLTAAVAESVEISQCEPVSRRP